MLKHVCLRTKHTNDPRMSGRPIRQRWHSARLVSRTHTQTHTHTHTHTRMQFWKRDSPSPSKNIKRFHHSRARLSLSLSLSLSAMHIIIPLISPSRRICQLCFAGESRRRVQAGLICSHDYLSEERKKKKNLRISPLCVPRACTVGFRPPPSLTCGPTEDVNNSAGFVSAVCAELVLMADQKSSLLRLSVRFVPEGIRNRIALLSPLAPYALIVPSEYDGLQPSHNFVMSGFF